jgi:hypothetical protein
MSHFLREFGALGVPTALALAVIIWKYRNPQLYASNIVAPGDRFNRIQHVGLSYVGLGVAVIVVTPIFLHFHPLDPGYYAGSLVEAVVLIGVGAMAFLVGWNRRRQPDSSPPE